MQQDHSKHAWVRKQGRKQPFIQYNIYQQDETKAVLLVDAENAFNSVNRKAMLHNIFITCPLITTLIVNCYMEPPRLFIVRNHEIESREGTTQGDPTAMRGVTPLILFLSELIFINEHRAQQSICGQF